MRPVGPGPGGMGAKRSTAPAKITDGRSEQQPATTGSGVCTGRRLYGEQAPRSGDSNAKPTGGTRQVTYKLVPGEAMWQLKPVYSAQF